MSTSDFYIGRVVDSKTGKLTTQTVEYDPADLTTHAFVTGMTGSGKTGLCITLLEEAALQGIPALIIDPKGDLTNVLLHFPNLAPQDFEPWIDAEMVRRAGKNVQEAAVEAADAWRKGLAEWDIPVSRISALAKSATFTVFTPGSDSGIPVSVLSSLAAPRIPWEGNRDVLREKISSTVTALLGLVGFEDIDPVRSREHILLANLFEAAWSNGRDVDLAELILQTQSPPFERLGALSVDDFFPPKERRDLAMTLNNILAAPAFQVWREGEPLDIHSMLFTDDNRPRHSVFYLAHLSDAERMFFVTLFFAAIEAWMREQAGVATLRALLYMDEIHGYLPPVASPPSKGPLLRMLKQARAFGLGLMLATQNPVDMDYKALSNAGTWFIGKLQTERDKERLLDGLEGAGTGASRASLDKLIGSLGKRVFLLHNVHSKQPILMQSRWAMNFLAGPLTRTQIPALNRLSGMSAPGGRGAGMEAPAARRKQSVEGRGSGPTGAVVGASVETSLTRQPAPVGTREYFLAQSNSLPEAFAAAGRAAEAGATIKAVVYRPGLLAAAQVRILDRKYGIDTDVTRTAVVLSPDRRGVMRWEDHVDRGTAPDKFEGSPAAEARFAPLDLPLSDAKVMTALQRDFTDWIFRNSSLKVRANPTLKVYAGPDGSQAEFVKTCAEAARQFRDQELNKEAAQLDRQLKALQDKLAREERELRQDQQDLQSRKLEAGANLLEIGAGLIGFGRKKSVSSQFTKQRLSQSAQADVDESMQLIQQYQAQIADLQKQREELSASINDRWAGVVNNVSEIEISPKKSDVFVNMFGIAWLPYYIVEAGQDHFELPAFSAT